jgi:hypothetical protein
VRELKNVGLDAAKDFDSFLLTCFAILYYTVVLKPALNIKFSAAMATMVTMATIVIITLRRSGLHSKPY